MPEAPSRAVQDLLHNKLFSGLSAPEVETVAASFEPAEFAAGEAILAKEAGGRVYLLAAGRAEVRTLLPASDGEELRVASLEAGDFFAEASFFTQTSEPASRVHALTPVRTYSVGREDFLKLLSARPLVMRNVMAEHIAYIQASNQLLLDTVRREKEELSARVSETTRQLGRLSARVSRELAVAQSIQRNLLPEKRMSFPRVSVRTEYVPCDELSGDIVGAFAIDDLHVGVYGGDVCGHGIHAAMVMSYVKKLITSSVKRMLLNRQYITKPPGAVLTSINESFFSEVSLGDPEISLSLFLGVLDVRGFRFEYSSAGIHVPPLVFSGSRLTELFFESDHPIGYVRGHQYETSTASFGAGDTLLFASDGVVEAHRGGEIYGMERLKAAAAEIVSSSADPDPAAVVGSVRQFLGSGKPEDDMCILLMTMR